MGTISHHTISLDGCIAGPDDAMDWAFEYGEATCLADGTLHRIGAILAGRRWYELASRDLRREPEPAARAARRGVRLFGGEGAGRIELERISVGEAERLTDLRFRVVGRVSP